MEIKNKKATIRAKFWLVRMPLLIFLVILVLTLLEVLPSPVWLFIAAGLFIFTLLIVIIGRFHYVHFSIDQEEIIIRYYHIFPLLRDFQEILIQQSDEPDFSLERTFFGKVPVLIITLHTSRGSAKYPPIPISLLPRIETEELLKALKK